MNHYRGLHYNAAYLGYRRRLRRGADGGWILVLAALVVGG